MLTHKGDSMIMWVVTFSALIAALAIIRVPLNRALQGKAKGMTDQILWKQWKSAPEQYLQNEKPEQYLRDENSRTKNKTVQQDTRRFSESHQGVTVKETKPGDNYREESSVSSSVADGSEVVLKTFDLDAE